MTSKSTIEHALVKAVDHKLFDDPVTPEPLPEYNLPPSPPVLQHIKIEITRAPFQFPEDK